jgi:hypothetical protein
MLVLLYPEGIRDPSPQLPLLGPQEEVGFVENGDVRESSPFIHRFEIEIEPIFGILALYDVREKKKVGALFLLLPPPLPPCCGGGGWASWRR